MWDFRKKRQEAEQQRKIEQLLDAQEAFLALYEQPTRPTSLQGELRAVTSFFGDCRRNSMSQDDQK